MRKIVLITLAVAAVMPQVLFGMDIRTGRELPLIGIDPVKRMEERETTPEDSPIFKRRQMQNLLEREKGRPATQPLSHEDPYRIKALKSSGTEATPAEFWAAWDDPATKTKMFIEDTCVISAGAYSAACNPEITRIMNKAVEFASTPERYKELRELIEKIRTSSKASTFWPAVVAASEMLQQKEQIATLQVQLQAAQTPEEKKKLEDEIQDLQKKLQSLQASSKEPVATPQPRPIPGYGSPIQIPPWFGGGITDLKTAARAGDYWGVIDLLKGGAKVSINDLQAAIDGANTKDRSKLMILDRMLKAGPIDWVAVDAACAYAAAKKFGKDDMIVNYLSGQAVTFDIPGDFFLKPGGMYAEYVRPMRHITLQLPARPSATPTKEDVSVPAKTPIDLKQQLQDLKAQMEKLKTKEQIDLEKQIQDLQGQLSQQEREKREEIKQRGEIARPQATEHQNTRSCFALSSCMSISLS